MWSRGDCGVSTYEIDIKTQKLLLSMPRSYSSSKRNGVGENVVFQHMNLTSKLRNLYYPCQKVRAHPRGISQLQIKPDMNKQYDKVKCQITKPGLLLFESGASMNSK